MRCIFASAIKPCLYLYTKVECLPSFVLSFQPLIRVKLERLTFLPLV